MGQTGNDSVLHILFISGGTCLYSDEFSEHSDKMSFSNLFFFKIVSRFVCHCGFLGQSGVKVPKAKKTLKQSLRYRPPVVSLVCGE